jgi:hypothetical protein
MPVITVQLVIDVSQHRAFFLSILHVRRANVLLNVVQLRAQIDTIAAAAVILALQIVPK